MAGERADTVAIMAAIIYAGRTGESAQAPNETAVVLQRASRVIGGREALFKGVEMRLDARR